MGDKPTPELLRHFARKFVVSTAEAEALKKSEIGKDLFWANEFASLTERIFLKAAKSAGLSEGEAWGMIKEQAEFLATLNEEQFKELMSPPEDPQSSSTS